MLNTFLTLPPLTPFERSGKNGSNYKRIVYHVPRNRDRDDPFYIVVEVETDTHLYWTSPQNVQYAVEKKFLV